MFCVYYCKPYYLQGDLIYVLPQSVIWHLLTPCQPLSPRGGANQAFPSKHIISPPVLSLSPYTCVLFSYITHRIDYVNELIEYYLRAFKHSACVEKILLWMVILFKLYLILLYYIILKLKEGDFFGLNQNNIQDMGK